MKWNEEMKNPDDGAGVSRRCQAPMPPRVEFCCHFFQGVLPRDVPAGPYRCRFAPLEALRQSQPPTPAGPPPG